MGKKSHGCYNQQNNATIYPGLKWILEDLNISGLARNVMGADVLTTQGGRASATMILIGSCIAGRQCLNDQIWEIVFISVEAKHFQAYLDSDYVVCVRQTSYRVSSWCLISSNARFPPLMYCWSQHVHGVYRSQTLRENPYKGGPDF